MQDKFLFFIFVSSVETFNLASHLGTHPKLVDRVYNRPTLQTLETKSIKGSVKPNIINVSFCSVVCSVFCFFVFQSHVLFTDNSLSVKSTIFSVLVVNYFSVEPSEVKIPPVCFTCRNWPSRGSISIKSSLKGLTERRKCLSSARKSRPVKTYR